MGAITQVFTYITTFLYKWQSGLGALIGGLLGFVAALYVFHRKENVEKQRNVLYQYRLMLSLLIEIKMVIRRCEGLKRKYQPKLDQKSGKESKFISFSNLYTPSFNAQWGKLDYAIFDVEIIDSIEKIYYAFFLVSFNIEKANVGPAVEDYRYGSAIAFIDEYLLDIYTRYNRICRLIRKIGEENQFEFPKALNGYSKPYMDKIASDFKIKNNQIQ